MPLLTELGFKGNNGLQRCRAYGAKNRGAKNAGQKLEGKIGSKFLFVSFASFVVKFPPR